MCVCTSHSQLCTWLHNWIVVWIFNAQLDWRVHTISESRSRTNCNVRGVHACTSHYVHRSCPWTTYQILVGCQISHEMPNRRWITVSCVWSNLYWNSTSWRWDQDERDPNRRALSPGCVHPSGTSATSSPLYLSSVLLINVLFQPDPWKFWKNWGRQKPDPKIVARRTSFKQLTGPAILATTLYSLPQKSDLTGERSKWLPTQNVKMQCFPLSDWLRILGFAQFRFVRSEHPAFLHLAV